MHFITGQWDCSWRRNFESWAGMPFTRLIGAPILINNICGLAALLIGDALPTLFIAFSLVSLAGGYLYYRAFMIAFPDGDRLLFGLLVILSPSLLFWSSFIGKDSLIQYFHRD